MKKLVVLMVCALGLPFTLGLVSETAQAQEGGGGGQTSYDFEDDLV